VLTGTTEPAEPERRNAASLQAFGALVSTVGFLALVVELVLLALAVAQPVGPHAVAALGAAGLCVLPALLEPMPVRRTAWLALGAALLTTVAPWGRQAQIGSDLLAVLGVWLLARSTRPRWSSGRWGEALVVALGALAAGVAVGIGPLATATAAALLAGAALAGSAAGLTATALAVGATLVEVDHALTLRTTVVLTGGPWAGRTIPAWQTLAGLVGLLVIAVAAVVTCYRGRRAVERRLTPPSRPTLLPMVAIGSALGLLAQGLVNPDTPRAASLLAIATLAVAITRNSGPWRPPFHAWGTDELTGLPSRQALSRALAPGGEASPDGGWRVAAADRMALLLVDLDRFREVNEALGNDAGDQVLTEVGERLQGVLRSEQVLARLGSDEFAVVLPGADEQGALRVAGALRDSLTRPFAVPLGAADPQPVFVQASVGVATCLLPRGNPEDLLRQADAAVHDAKGTDTGIACYDPSRDPGPARLQRIADLHQAVGNGELEVHLQPQVDLARGVVVGAEALARWRHPQHGVLLPAAFLPLMAQSGLTRPLVDLVLARALEACATWWHAGHQVSVSVNVNADDLLRHDLGPDDSGHDLLDLVIHQLHRHDLPGRALKLELTEDVRLTDGHAVAAALEPLRRLGVQVALDDYGTGYATLSYLHELPLDQLKLDRQFVVDLAHRRTQTLVRHTVAMAHSLGMVVVGEGVEDERTARLLADTGADMGQGLYFGDAVDLATFVDQLTRERG
jgi:diguanylate cyclase